AFLVGAGYFEGGMFRLEQAFMRDFDDEEPMLRYLDGVFTGRDTVVSYNGKSFDIPLLRTRFIQNRIPFRLDGALQYDLLHAARRFWKRRLGDCGLTNIEREVLGVRRYGDVSSAEIPELWLEYLRTRDARPLEAVFYHHKMDVLSLAALAGRLSQSLNLPQGTGFDHLEDRLSLVRLHFMQKNYQEVTEHGRRLLEEEAEVAIRCECLYLMGMACKRLQQWIEMEDAWTLLLAERPRDLVARLELAKYYEHRVRDLLAAERICEETLQFLETRSALGADELPLGLETFRVRLERIQRKLGRM
ncbi:MAG TPA: ribonuclease H-like domain-containing protein, partial [Candidatus Hydrogenedentes bacterium]|nr:ribonuclease H-like domain-containing protein [Candidatus Hydrogenedentota bacterium]